jgi:hypothetical protein
LHVRACAAAVVLGAALVAGSIGCSPSPQADPCPGAMLGDGGAPDFDMLIVSSDYTVRGLSEGDVVPVMLPPQGGRVIFVGVRATNVCAKGVQITGALRDLTTRQVRVDSRTTNLVPAADGWGLSAPVGSVVSDQISDFSNVPVCPNQWASSDVYGHDFGLEVTIADKLGRTLTKKIVVSPECGEPASSAQCLCICKAGYILGEACDGGADGSAQ